MFKNPADRLKNVYEVALTDIWVTASSTAPLSGARREYRDVEYHSERSVRLDSTKCGFEPDVIEVVVVVCSLQGRWDTVRGFKTNAYRKG